MALLLLIQSPIVCVFLVFGPCFEMQYLVLQSYHEVSWLLYFNCALSIFLCLFLGCNDLVCGLVIVTFLGHSYLLFVFKNVKSVVNL